MLGISYWVFLSPLCTELHAILNALDLVLEKNWLQVSIKSDSKMAVDICTSRTSLSGHHQSLIF